MWFRKKKGVCQSISYVTGPVAAYAPLAVDAVRIVFEHWNEVPEWVGVSNGQVYAILHGRVYVYHYDLASATTRGELGQAIRRETEAIVQSSRSFAAYRQLVRAALLDATANVVNSA